MITAHELARLMQQAFDDKEAEPAFLRALMGATVYAHAPRSDRSSRLRFIQFTTPEGLTVLPFFSDEAQAKSAAGSVATVVALMGRQLFELTRGATLMLNPNEVSCTLYPEEIIALLDRGEVAIVEKVDTGGQELLIGPASENPAWLMSRLVSLYANLGCVEAAYLADISSPAYPERRGLLVAVAVQTKDAERAARATTTELQVHCRALQTAVDLTAFEPGKMPDWLKDAGLAPFYVRVLDERLVPAPKGLQ